MIKKLTPKQRTRLTEIKTYRPSGPATINAPFKGDITDRSLLAHGLIEVATRRMKTPAMREPGEVSVCWITEAGRKALQA